MEINKDNNIQGWRWKQMEGLPISINEISQLSDLIRARSLNPIIGKDSLVWASSKTGQYNAKDGYKVLENYGEQEDQVIPQKLYWNSKNIPKKDSNKVFSSWDDNIRCNWIGIKIPPSLGEKTSARANAKWSPPKQGWLKLNFDGASKGNPGASGIENVIRDHKGTIVGKMAMPMPPDANNIAEFKALHLGLIDYHKHGIKNLIVEGDSAIAIKAIKTRRIPNWRLQAILDSILENLTKLDNFVSKHVYREANTEANELSKSAAEGISLHWWEDNNNLRGFNL
ncbi:uncharacterized protein LOC131858375 [Cryptomeria japonica]|uniref:uncharacterized protein LOC131858375 n=1 Tax=Cryptomeria japonica TaxID=3369 RepID=UPI0027DA5E7B|nr:uncharacterized protein LOC131858375 [Cryptomeria japonica]